MSVAFDTLKFAQTLRDKAKLSPEQAEGISQAFAEASGEQLATKADFTALSAKVDGLSARVDGLATRLDGVETRLDGLATKEELKAAISDAKADLLKWMFGQTLLIIGVLMALLRFGH